MAMRNNRDYWHEDLVIEILLKLPVKSIIRFKSVSRTWYHLIKSHTFVSQHFALSKRNTRLLVRCPHGNGTCQNVVVIPLVDDQQTFAPNNCRFLLQPPYRFGNEYSVHGKSVLVDNGLVCFCGSGKPDYGITLWNPATRECRNLPQCDLGIPASAHYFTRPLLGFGFDPISNDYKVIRIQKYFMHQTGLETGCAVYKMSTDSWRVMNKEDVEIFRGTVYRLMYYQACANGVYYWLARKHSHLGRETTEILTFRFGDESFQQVLLPPGTSGELLDFHDDGVALWSIKKSGNDQSYEIWMLNDEGHWTKQWRIEYLPRVSRVLCVWKKGKVFVSSVDEDLWLWDIDAKECIYIGNGIKPGQDWRGLSHIFLYEESLVSIGRE